MSRRKRYVDHDREPGRFAAIPFDVLTSSKFAALTPAAVKLLLDLLVQYNGKNNGQFLATWDRMRKRGWRGEHQLVNARRELAEAGLIFETRKGARPNRAAWWAITWYSLHWHSEMDIKPAAYVRGLWRIRGGLVCAGNAQKEAPCIAGRSTTTVREAASTGVETGRIAAPGAVAGQFPTAPEAPMAPFATTVEAASKPPRIGELDQIDGRVIAGNEAVAR